MIGSLARRMLAVVLAAACLLLPRPGAPAAAEAGPAWVVCQQQVSPAGALSELRVRGQVVMRLRTPAAGMEPAERCELVRQRLLGTLASGRPLDPRPVVIQGLPAVVAGGQLLVTVLAATAELNGTTPALLAWHWANNLRQALNLPALPLSEAPYDGLPGIERARVSWYGWELAGRRTASGEPFSPQDFTAAHRSLPFGTRVRVIAPWSGRQVIVRINDRGPWVHGRAFDISLAAARELGLDSRGVADVLVEVLQEPAR